MMGKRATVRTVVLAVALATAFSFATSSGAWAGSVQPGGQPGGGHTGGGGGGTGGTDSQVSLSVPSQTVMEGFNLEQPIATFTDPDPNATAAQYTATAQFAVGAMPVPVTITQTSPAGSSPEQFAITGYHTATDTGSFPICIKVADVDANNGTLGCGTATVTEAPITAFGITGASTNPYCHRVALFADANTKAFAGDFTITIDWGDGTVEPGNVVATRPGSEPGEFPVQGCHSYADLGPHTVTTTLVDSDLTVTATSTAWVYALTDGGSFVAGDQSSTLGGSVTFWGAAWAAANSLSGGPAPESFKGFADDRAPACGTAWSTGPGNSAHPPDVVPSYTAVLIAGTITKNDPEVTGDTVHVALVRTDPGYGPDPGQAGTGTIVYMIC